MISKVTFSRAKIRTEEVTFEIINTNTILIYVRTVRLLALIAGNLWNPLPQHNSIVCQNGGANFSSREGHLWNHLHQHNYIVCQNGTVFSLREGHLWNHLHLLG
jgi:hypothetical protein